MARARIVSPSILSADFANLESEINAVLKAGAQWIHVDVMDAHFVPNLTIGAPVVKSLRKVTKAFLDVHLMIEKPEKWVDDYINAGADLVTCHIEAVEDFSVFASKLKKAGVKVGVSLKPKTKLEKIIPLLDQADLVLVMTVEPGFGGQSFMEDQLEKIKNLAEIREQKNLDFHIEVDGGIDENTVQKCASAGADVFVAGSYVFGGDYKERIASLKKS